jgi:predicted phosphodiesterase
MDLERVVNKHNLSEAELTAVIDRIKNPDLRPKSFEHRWATRHIKIGLMSDTHIGSNYEDIPTLRDLFKRFRKESIDALYVSGDITEGYNMRPGHSFECNLHGADAQIDGVVKSFPRGVPIYFITGDHDYSHFKRQGIDVGKHIEKERDDMTYLGPFDATINLSKNTNLMMTHPSKGTAYALSYHPQKMAEAFSGGEKPNILSIGHYHKIEQLFYRNIHIFQAGCIQNQTGWMKRMNLAAHKGGWVLDVYMKKDGTIDRLDSKLFPYYI